MSEGTATIEDAVAVEAPARKRKRNTKRKKQPRYHVVLWDDNDHSYGYVIMMLRSIFGHPARNRPENGSQRLIRTAEWFA